MKNTFQIILLSLLTLPLFAQNSLTVGVDLLVPTSLGGFEAEAGYNFGKNRIAFEFLGSELPAVWNSQIDDFEKVSVDIYEVAFSRFINDRQKGFHYGLAYSFLSDFTVEDADGATRSKDISKLGVRLGYMWFPFKKVGFFIEPLFNFGFFLDDENLDFGNGEIFDEKSFNGSGPVIHFGWKFNL